jgi:hypothetical protein
MNNFAVTAIDAKRRTCEIQGAPVRYRLWSGVHNDTLIDLVEVL